MLRGAKARREFVDSTPAAGAKARAQLVSQGVFPEDPSSLTLSQDYDVHSGSQAAEDSSGSFRRAGSMSNPA